MRFDLLALPLLVVSSLGCGEPRATIDVRFNDAPLYRCEGAEVSALTPKPGGWAFKCDDGSNIYFVYETSDTPAKGTIETITIQPRDKSGPQPRAMLLVGDESTRDCPNGETERGGEPFPTGLRGVEGGSYTFDLVEPCGKLEVVIDRR
jgi:hypothetical protein